MYGIVNDPQAAVGMSVKDTVNWLKALMDNHGAKTIIVSREWARRLELEGFDMSMITVARPLQWPVKYPSQWRLPVIPDNTKGPRSRWGTLK
jgi:hypothetical protein